MKGSASRQGAKRARAVSSRPPWRVAEMVPSVESVPISWPLKSRIRESPR